jgi:hypothetical protein
MRNPKVLNAIQADARAVVRSAQVAGLSSFFGSKWDTVLSGINYLGVGVPIFNCITGIMEDTKKGYSPEVLDDQVYYRIERMIGEISASLVSRVTIGYLFKLPAGTQKLFGWFPGFTKVTDVIAKLGPTAQAGLQAYLMTPDGRKMLDEWFDSSAFGDSQSRWLREMGARYLKDWTDPLIAKVQDYVDPNNAPARQEFRNQNTPAKREPTPYQGTNSLRFDDYGRLIK